MEEFALQAAMFSAILAAAKVIDKMITRNRDQVLTMKVDRVAETVEKSDPHGRPLLYCEVDSLSELPQSIVDLERKLHDVDSRLKSIERRCEETKTEYSSVRDAVKDLTTAVRDLSE
jgi:chromosome segregation ATPase